MIGAFFIGVIEWPESLQLNSITARRGNNAEKHINNQCMDYAKDVWLMANMYLEMRCITRYI